MNNVVAWTAVVGTMVVACARPVPAQAPPAAPATPAAAFPAAPAGHAQPAEPAPASAPAPAAPPPAEAPGRDERALAPDHGGTPDLARAEQQIQSADCGTACRALGSIERAIAMLCRADGDPERCTSARALLRRSRKHVRDACGSCADGPSVDPDAPVPSRP